MTSTPDGRPEGRERNARPPESASFETARLRGGGGRGRPPVLAFGFVAVLGMVVAAGVGGRLGGGSFPKGGGELTAPSADPLESAEGPTVDPFASPRLPAFPEDAGPVYTSGPGPMHVQAKRHPQTMFVHGDIDAASITWVYVGVLDDAGRVAGWTSVSVPGSAGPNANGGPTMRFDVELAIPPDFTGRLWVRAQAYGADGTVVASTNVEIPTR